MQIRQIAKIQGGQDGAIWKDELFRFNTKGECTVYDLKEIDSEKVKELEPIGRFTLDKADIIAPHSNAVFWGVEFFDPSDEYPLLYANIYNNYAKAEDKLTGVCCAYRVEKTESGFKTTLVQLIEIGFTDDPALWRAFPDRDGVRPYGNFVIDREGGYYYAFVMRTEALGTRYFKFKIPHFRDGEIDSVFGVRRAVLTAEDICDSFDCPYHRFIQGATLHGGYIYSTEGFDGDEINRPAIRVIDLSEKCERLYVDLMENGYKAEPEMIDFHGDSCYYSDAKGNFYKLDLDLL